MKIILRKGKKKDILKVLELIKELALFEKSPLEVDVTANKMINWGFGKEKVFDFFVVEKESVIIGMALYYYKYSTWKGKCLFLEDIIVTEKERKNGYGKMLFKKVIEIAKDKKVKRLEWQVLNWNIEAIEFYKKFDASFDEEWINCKLKDNQLENIDC